jgi:phosphomannomutase/phosphoglucomutase
MAKKKPKQSKPNKKSAAKPKNALRQSVVSSAILCVLVAAASFIYLGLVDRTANNQNNIKVQAQALAKSQASLINQTLHQLRIRLSSSANSTGLSTALDNNDPLALSQQQQILQRTFPEAYTVKIIRLGPLGIAALEQQQLRNNIELDLVRAASNGNKVEPEAYQVDNQWLFSITQPVRSDNKDYVSGALLVTFDKEYLREQLKQLDNNLGSTSLLQQFKAKEHVIATTGPDNANALSAIAATITPSWKIRFTPSTTLIANSSQESLIIWILMAVVLTTLLLAAVLTLKQLQQAISNNLKLLDSKAGKSNDYDLPGFQQFAVELSEKLASAEAAVAAQEKAALTTPVSAPPVITHNDVLELDLAIPTDIPATIFRAYDIRGIAEQQLTDDIVYAIGLAIGSEALDQGQQTVVLAADGRNSSPQIRDALTKGLQASGRDVIDIGIMPTPLMYFATHQLGTQTGVMITGSHNPAEYNGIKIVIGGRALSGDAIANLRQRILDKQFTSGHGEYRAQDVEQSYIDYIINDVAIAQPLKIVIDAGNGVAGVIAPKLFEELGCEVIPLYCEVDGNFPNHHPDPTVESNLTDLKKMVQEQGADLGIAFDGDGDRLGVVTATGQSVPADRLLMLLAQDVVSRNPGADVIFDVKCTRNLNTLISNYGGRPIMWKSGHSFMKEKMAETGALLGGEFSGHIFFKERWFGFDDGMYAAARLIEILSTTDPDLDLQLQAFPESASTPELKIETGEERKFSIMDQLITSAQFDDGKISTLDGLRVDFADGWGLVRASNTTPTLVLRFEADNKEALQRIQNQFKQQLSAIESTLQFSF